MLMLPRFRILDNEYAYDKDTKTKAYIDELESIGSTGRPMEPYVSRKTPIVHKYMCGHQRKVTPASLLQGCGCKRCELKQRKLFSQEDFLCKLKKTNPTIIPLDPYVNAKTKIRVRYSECGHENMVIPDNLYKGIGCPFCKGVGKTTVDFKKELSVISPTIAVLGEYTLAKNRLPVKCMVCNHEWTPTAGSLLAGFGCPSCAIIRNHDKSRLTHQQYLDKIKSQNLKAVPLEQYINARTPIRHRYFECGHESVVTPWRILSGSGCDYCNRQKVGDKFRKSHEEFESFVQKLHPEIELLSEYKGAHKNVKVRIRDTEEIKELTAGALLVSGSYTQKQYKGEVAIMKCLDEYNIKYIHSKRFKDLRGSKRPLEYDFYLPNKHAAIEYQGKQHGQPIDHFGGAEHFAIQQEHDRLKREYAKEHDMKLIEIWYYDYDRIEEILIKELELETAETAG